MRYWLLLVLVSFIAPGHAKIVLSTQGGVEKPIPIAVIPFQVKGQMPEGVENLVNVVEQDLSLGGRFDLLSRFDTERVSELSLDAQKISYAYWRSSGVDFLVFGEIVVQPDGKFAIAWELLDVFNEARVHMSTPSGKVFKRPRLTVTQKQLRLASHYISDRVYEALTGARGVFTSKVIYVRDARVEGKRRYELVHADYDGKSATAIWHNTQPIMSPAWSPNGDQVAFVSFDKKRRSMVYVRDLRSGSQKAVATFEGVNGAPAWSPDGSELAFAASKDGNVEIYVVRVTNGAVRRITKNRAIDTEPVFSADGKDLVFTSDRGGKAQLYKTSAQGGQRASRLTFLGGQNTAADVSPDGKYLTFVHSESGRDRIALMTLASGDVDILTNGGRDESPSFAPNSQLIMYATKTPLGNELSITTIGGNQAKRMPIVGSAVREPEWSPKF